METLLMMLVVISMAGLVLIAIVLRNIYRVLYNTNTYLRELEDQIKSDRKDFSQTVLNTFRIEIASLAKQHASEQALICWLKEAEEKGGINVDKLSRETRDKVKALMICQAEQAVYYAEAALEDVRKSVLKCQIRIDRDPGMDFYKTEIRTLKEQENHCVVHLEAAVDRLKRVTAMATGHCAEERSSEECNKNLTMIVGGDRTDIVGNPDE